VLLDLNGANIVQESRDFVRPNKSYQHQGKKFINPFNICQMRVFNIKAACFQCSKKIMESSP